MNLLKPIFLNFCLLQVSHQEKNELEQIVSQKDTFSWLKSTSGSENSKSPFCKLCCIDITYHTIGKNCGSHTLCKYPKNKIGPSCKGYIRINFTEAEKSALLDAHNTIRNHIAGGQVSSQPRASNMRLLEWSQELEEVADRWAAQCINNNDECRDLEKYPVGQNIAFGNFALTNELTLVKTWYDEIARFNISDVYNFQLLERKRHPAKSYTQLVWAETYQIGCARAVFQENKGTSVSYRENVICNYGPTGNIPNLPVYKVGEPCSACQEGTTCGVQYENLCEGNPSNKFEIKGASDTNNALVENNCFICESKIYVNIVLCTISVFWYTCFYIPIIFK